MYHEYEMAVLFIKRRTLSIFQPLFTLDQEKEETYQTIKYEHDRMNGK